LERAARVSNDAEDGRVVLVGDRRLGRLLWGRGQRANDLPLDGDDFIVRGTGARPHRDVQVLQRLRMPFQALPAVRDAVPYPGLKLPVAFLDLSSNSINA